MFGEKELYKKVDKIALKEILPKHSYPPGQDYIVVDEDKNILNFCSGKYSLVKNEDIFKPIEDALQQQKLSYIRRIVIINKAKFYVDYIIKDRKDEGTITGIFPRISVWNSYDGGSMMRHELGYFRLLGNNSITIPNGKTTKEIYRHATSLQDGTTSTEEKVHQIVNDTVQFLANCKNDIQIFKKMEQKKVTKSQVASYAKKIGLSKKMQECAVARFELETSKEPIEYKNEHGEIVKHQGSEKSLFTLYNALNFAIYNMNTKELPEKKIEKDRKAINFLLELI